MGSRNDIGNIRDIVQHEDILSVGGRRSVEIERKQSWGPGWQTEVPQRGLGAEPAVGPKEKAPKAERYS